MLLCRPAFHEQPARLPTPGETTLCEVDGDLVHIRSNTDRKLLHLIRAGGAVFPLIKVPIDLPQHSQYQQSQRSTPQSQVDSTTSTTDGIRNVGASQNETTPSLTRVLSMVSNGIERIYSIATTVTSTMIEMRKIRGSSSLSTTETGRHDVKTHGPIRCTAWHPIRQVVAIAHTQDAIFLYDVDADVWFPSPPRGLTHPLIEDIRALVWSPASPTLLAVAVRSGVLLFRLILPTTSSTNSTQQQQQQQQQEQQTNASSDTITEERGVGTSGSGNAGKITLLGTSGGEQIRLISQFISEDVGNITFSPDGTTIVVGSRSTDVLSIFDVTTGNGTRISRTGGGGFTRAIAFSPDGRRLIQTCGSRVMRIWETATWTVIETLSTRGGVAHSLQWFPDGRTLLFAISGDNRVFVRVISTNGTSQRVGELYLAAFEEDSRGSSSNSSSSSEDDNDDDETKDIKDGVPVRSGGEVRSVAIDGTGRRVAVAFEEEKSGWGVALFALRGTGLPVLAPRGVVRGARDVRQVGVTFVPCAEAAGATLVLTQASGQLSLIPLLFGGANSST